MIVFFLRFILNGAVKSKRIKFVENSSEVQTKYLNDL